LAHFHFFPALFRLRWSKGKNFNLANACDWGLSRHAVRPLVIGHLWPQFCPIGYFFAQLTVNVVLGEVSLQQEKNKERVKENKIENQSTQNQSAWVKSIPGNYHVLIYC
jgi:hypothetical protein